MYTFDTRKEADNYRRKLKKANPKNTYHIEHYWQGVKLRFEVVMTNRFN